MAYDASKTLIERETISDLHQLGRTLANTGFIDLMAAYGNEEIRTNVILFDLPLLPRDLALIVELLHAGRRVGEADARKLLSSNVVESLLTLGLLRVDQDQIYSPHHRLVVHYGLPIFCEKPSPLAKLYYGNDSLALGRVIQPACGKVLDLCCGVGTQGLLCALTAEKVIGVDVEAAVVPIFEANRALNQMEDIAEIRLGNLIEPVLGERFDRVVCNPPLIPVPEDMGYPRHGNGGPDGLEFIAKILEHLPDLLNPDGRCQMIGTVLGNEQGPNLHRLETIARNVGLDILLILPCRESIAEGGRFLHALETTARNSNLNGDFHDRLVAHFKEMAVTHIFSFLLSARLTTPGRIRTTGHFVRNESFWTL